MYFLNVCRTAYEERHRDHVFDFESQSPSLENTSTVFLPDSKPYSEFSGPVYLWVYVGVTAAIIFLTLVRTIWFYGVSLNVSKWIHRKMFCSLLRAPTEFFDKNPSGKYTSTMYIYHQYQYLRTSRSARYNVSANCHKPRLPATKYRYST
jgi:hypothetical protein